MDVFDLYAKIGLDKSEYESGLKDAKGSMSSFASSVGNGLKTVAKIGATAIAAGAAGVAALTKMGVEGYAQYEQLVGGVETLFGNAGKSMDEYVKEVAKQVKNNGFTPDLEGIANRWRALEAVEQQVLANASNAYKTAGLSANDYMNTIMGFTAALKQTIDDTSAVADYADMAVTDMSDNANKMGTSMEMLQNAYNGFAKQNYTMLDNLKLGYGGTKEEMERLIADANKVKEANGEMADLSIDSFADVTEAIHIIQTEMGITGTTAKEASTTIEGSLSMMKGAWQNLVVGMADENANMGDLINNLVESTTTAMGNLIPRIEQTLAGIGQLVEGLAPVIANALPGLVSSVLPSLLNAAIGLVNSVISALPSLIEMLVTSVIPQLISGVVTAFTALVGMLPTLVESLVSALPSLIPQVVSGIVSMVVTLCEQFSSIIQPIIDYLPDVIMSICDAILTNLPLLIQGVLSLILGLVSALPDLIVSICEALPMIIDMVCQALIDNVPLLISAVIQIVGALISELPTIIMALVSAIPGILQSVWDAITGFFAPLGEWFNTSVVQPVANFFTNMWDGLKNGAKNAWEGITSVFSKVTNWFKDVFSNAWQKVKDVFSTGGKVFDGIKEGIVNVFKTVVNAIIGGINKVIAVPFNAINGILRGIKSIEIAGIKPFDWVNTFNVPQIPKLSTGLNFVPYDEFPAFLHRGEAVLTAAQAQSWRNGQGQPANGQMMAVLVAILEAITGGNQELIDAVLADKTFSISGREFGRLVKEYA